MPEPITWAALGVGAGTFAFVGGAGTVAGLRLLDQFNAIQRVASATATEFDFQLFERAIEDEASFRELTRQVQRTYQCLSTSCCGKISIPIAKRRADRLRIALRRVLTDNIRLPPLGPPLLRTDPMPRTAHTPTIRRPREEINALLEERQFRNSTIGQELLADVQREQEMEAAARAQREPAQGEPAQGEPAQGEPAQAGAAAASQPSASNQPSSQPRSDTTSQPGAVAQAAASLAQAARKAQDRRNAERQAQAQREIENRRVDVLAEEVRRRAAGQDVPQSAVRPPEDVQRQVRMLLRESGHIVHSSGSGSPLSSGRHTPLSSRAGAQQTPTSSRSGPFAPAAGYPASGAGAERLGTTTQGQAAPRGQAEAAAQPQNVQAEDLVGSRIGDSGWTASIPASAAATPRPAGLPSIRIPGQARKRNGDPGRIELQSLAQGPRPGGSDPQAQAAQSGIDRNAPQAQAAQQGAGGNAPQTQAAQPGIGRYTLPVQAVQQDAGGSASQTQAAGQGAGGSASQAQAAQSDTGGNAPQAQAAHLGTGQSAPQAQPSMASSISFNSLIHRGSSSPRSSTSAVISKADETIRQSQEVLASVRRSIGSSPDHSVHGVSSASPGTGTSQASAGTSSAAAAQQPAPKLGIAGRAAHTAQRRAPAGSTASTTSLASQPTPKIGSSMKAPRRDAQAEASSSGGGAASPGRRRAALPSEPIPEDLLRRRMLEKAAAEAASFIGLFETDSSTGFLGRAPRSGSSSSGSSGRRAARDPLGLGGISTIASGSDPGERLPERVDPARLLDTGHSSGGAGAAGSSRAGSRGRGDDSPRTRLAMAAVLPSSSSGSDAGRESPARRRPGKEPRQ